MPTYTVHVLDVTMAAPDIIRVVVNDQNVDLGNYLLLENPHASDINTTVQENNPAKGNELQYARVCGVDKKFLKFYDIEPTNFLDRVKAFNPANYSGSSLGGRTVTAVYHHSMPYDQGITFPAGSQQNRATFQHRIYLQLDGRLPPGGPYTISVLDNAFPSTQFTYGDTSTRFCFVHATQSGHRRADGDKVAYIAGWIPGYGTHGRVDYAATYGVTHFHIVDANARIHYTGEIALQINATTAEDAQANFRHPSTTQKWKATAITKANPGVVTYSGTGDPANGDILWAAGIGGMTQLEDAWLEVANVNTSANTFEIGSTNSKRVSGGVYVAFDGNTSTFGTYASGTYYTGTYDGDWSDQLFQTYLGNRAATFVWRLDYSNWLPNKNGLYRVYVPGIGVSYPFRIDEAVHYQRAKMDMKGFYNQCYGTALSASIGGWDRPVNFKNGVNGHVVKETKLAACFDAQNTDSPVATALSREVEDAPWATATEVDWWGGISDAGDWDFHVLRHIPIAYALLDAYEDLPAGARDVLFGFPKSSASISSAYAAADRLGDAVHMAWWLLEPLRRTQKGPGHAWGEGHVYGGLQVDGDGGGVAGGGNTWEPSWNTQQSIWVLAGDHMSAFHYAAAAAKLALVLKGAGLTALSDLWYWSALKAYTWADALYQDYAVNGATGAVIQSYFNTQLGTQTGMSWNDATFATRMGSLQTACQATTFGQIGGPRLQAQMVFWRLTGNASWGTYVDGLATGALQDYGTTAWEYTQAPAGDATKKNYYKGRMALRADNAYSEHFTGSTSYRQYNDGVYFSPSDPTILLRAFRTQTAPNQNQSNKYMKLLHAGENFWDGGNQGGMSCTVGVGSRWHGQPLIRDREAMGIRGGEGPQGTTVYMWNVNNFPGIPQFNAQIGDSVLNFTSRIPATAGRVKYTIDPFVYSIPMAMQTWENTYFIYHAEFTTQQSIATRFIANWFRHAWDGNTETSFRDNRKYGITIGL